jgi:hypothetical protein
MIRTLSYRDLTPEQRAKGAKKARERLLALLNNPFLTVDQKKSIYDKITHIGHWEKLQIALPGPAPKNHSVGVGDSVRAGEKLS